MVNTSPNIWHEHVFPNLTLKFLALPDNVKGAFAIFTAAMIFSVMVTLIKLAGERLHVTQILLVRQVIMMAIVMPSVISNYPNSFKTERLNLQLFRVACALVAMLSGFYAVINLPLAEVTAIGFVKAFFITIFAILILKEQVGIRRWSAVIIGFLGVLLMIRPGMDGFNPISLLALLGSAFAGLVMVIIRLLSRTDAPITTLSYQAFLVGIAMIVPGLYFWITPTAHEWMLLIAMGATSYAAQMLNIYAYKWGEASVIASLDYVRLLYATLLGYFIFNTLPDPYTWLGAAVIVAASIYTVHRERTKKQVLASTEDGRGIT